MAPVFRRRRASEDPVDTAEDVVAEQIAAADEAQAVAAYDRGAGPYDDSEVPDTWVVGLDLGALRIPPREGLAVNIDVDPATGAVVAVVLSLGTAAVQVQPFAAPRSAGLWDDVRGELRTQISSGGGLVDVVDGPFGPELRTQVPASLPDGTSGIQPARFTGIDGPRWFLRAVFLGDAATDPQAAAALEDTVRSLVVVRGVDAMAPGEPLPLRPPDGVGAEEPVAENARPLDPFHRGPEITEVR